MNLITSPLISAQKSLKKPKLIPSGHGLLKLSQSHIAALTSTSEKGLVRLLRSTTDSVLKQRLPTPGLPTVLALK
jgi:hypothetical protein